MSVAPAAFRRVDGGGGGVAGGEHGVERDGDALGEVGGDLGVVLDRLQRRLVAVEADEADAGGGDELEDAVEEAVAGAQDRDEGELLALEDGGVHLGERGADGLHRHRQVAGDLVGEEEADLAQELAEARGRGVVLAHERELVLDQRVVDDLQVLGHRLLCAGRMRSDLSTATDRKKARTRRLRGGWLRI